jgi:Ran GTPase-activating protein (RanGAP) involved in mRNA processing and transport
MLFGQKWPKRHVFAPFKLIENNLKGVKMIQNRSKPWAIVHAFWSKMAKMHVFAAFKLIENNLKGVKMIQNRSKPWAIVHAF